MIPQPVGAQNGMSREGSLKSHGNGRPRFPRGDAVLLEFLQFSKGCLEGFLEKGDAAVEAHEDVAGVVEAFAEGGAVAAGGVVGVEFPEGGFGAEEAAEGPFGAGEGGDGGRA